LPVPVQVQYDVDQGTITYGGRTRKLALVEYHCCIGF
jgi:hypothetical protein